MALHKLNTFHWHLTDDQGWRIAIEKYPRLVETARVASTPSGRAARADHVQPASRGRYTQDDVRDIVRYASERYVTIVPEIDMPGHMQAAIAAYPELGVLDEAPVVSPDWGVHTYLLNVDESTFAFIDDVLAELIALFPGRYVHVGGDEAAKDQWQASARIQARMRELGVPNEAALQSYFIKRLEKFLAAHGRKLVGWDEILEGGLPPEATVMSWRGTQGAIDAARQGHDVVLAPSPTLYFDAYQGNPQFEPLAIGALTTAGTVYDYHPPTGAHVLGVQGNLWTRVHPDAPTQLWYMAFPRELALAEIGWTPPARRDGGDFALRLGPALARLEREGVPFRIPAPAFRAGGAALDLPDQQFVRNHTAVAVAGDVDVGLSETVPDATIRYTLDGTLPSAASPPYAAPLHVALAPGGHATVAAIAVLPDGRRSAPAFFDLSRPARS